MPDDFNANNRKDLKIMVALGIIGKIILGILGILWKIIVWIWGLLWNILGVVFVIGIFAFVIWLRIKFGKYDD